MSFDVIAASRLEQRNSTPWRLVVDTGLQMGGIGIALAFVGILSMFNNRPIIVGVVTLGYATLGLLFFLAGILVGIRRPFATLSMMMPAGAVAGTIAAAMVAVLPVVMSFFSLRFIFLASTSLCSTC